MSDSDNQATVTAEQPFVSHLLELRDRLLRSVLGVLVIFIVLFPFANDLYTALSVPLRETLPEGSTMIAIDVASSFLTPFKLALVLSIYLAMPVILHQAWSFIAPGLYRHEKRLALPLLVSSSLLFYLGMAFAYFVVFPLVFGFLTSTTPDGVEMMTDINKYLDFVLTLFFAFGIAFEVPIATILVIATGMTTKDKLKEKRPYVIVGAFVIGMFLTPPDVISQSLLALPMWLLFEIGLIASGWFVDEAAAARKAAEAAADAESENSIGGYYADDYEALSDQEMEDELNSMDDDDDGPESTEKQDVKKATTPKKDMTEAEMAEMHRKALAGELKEGDWEDRGFVPEGLDEELDIYGDQGDGQNETDSDDKPDDAKPENGDKT